MFRKASLFFLLSMSALLPGCGSDDETVNITNYSSLAQVVFATQPQNVNLGSTLPALRIEGRDQFGNVINVSQGQVELRLGTNLSGANLLVNGSAVASTTATVANGAATFSGIGIDRVGTGYTLVATFTAPNTTGSLSTTSQAFNVNTLGSVSSVVFLRSTESLFGVKGGESDVSTLNTAFGAGNWTQGNFETANAAQVFQGNRLVFMDGGDDGATAFNTFVTANNTTISSFVQGGGRVIFNAAPTLGGNITTPFNATLNYDDANATTWRLRGTVDSTHPIGVACNGTLDFDGSRFFSSALVEGENLTPIITGPLLQAITVGPTSNVVLAEGRAGSGLYLIGGMATADQHSPQPQADNLRVNILRYAGGFPLIPAGPLENR